MVCVCVCVCVFGFIVFSHSHLVKQQLKESGGQPCVTDIYQLFLHAFTSVASLPSLELL